MNIFEIFVMQMKKKNTILIPGIGAIILLIAVQIFIIKDIWLEKGLMFDLKYKALSQEAMEQFNNLNNADGFENALEAVNQWSGEVMTQDLPKVTNDLDLSQLRIDSYTAVNKLLNELQTLNKMLAGYFDAHGFESDFSFQIVINSLQLIDFDKKVDIYPFPEDYRDNPDITLPETETNGQKIKSRILVKRFLREDNYYILNFDYYIDFSGKQKVVLREMVASISLSSISILVVVIIFMVAFRNLIEERRLSNLKTDFINNMTHELKTPLSTITVAGKTLEMDKIRAEEGKVLETARLIGKQSVHLNQLINLILEISMWERTQFQLDKKTVDIEELMFDIVDSFRTGCNNCAAVTQKYTLDNVKADIDVVYFTTLINNLLSNAVKYSSADPEIEINGSKDKNKIFISIRDNGIGIDKNHQKHIFDKFYRVTTGNIHKTKGLGLGLYYVKRIAEAHGGDVNVTSKPGKGSIFTVTIPY